MNDFQENGGSIVGYPGAAPYEGENLLFEKCDILIPAASEQQIHKGNAHKIQAKVGYQYFYSHKQFFITIFGGPGRPIAKVGVSIGI